MMIAEEPVKCKVMTEHVIIEQVKMEIQHLGVLLTSNGWLEKEVDQQVDKMNRIE